MRVVEGDQHRAGLGEVRGQPVQPVNQREAQVQRRPSSARCGLTEPNIVDTTALPLTGQGTIPAPGGTATIACNGTTAHSVANHVTLRAVAVGNLH